MVDAQVVGQMPVFKWATNPGASAMMAPETAECARFYG